MKNNKQPEIRFPGFHEEWEQRKLMDIGTINTGNTPPTNDNNNYSENGMLWVTPTDITSLVIKNTAKKLSATGERKARIAPTGTILVTCIASIGKNTMILNNSGFNQQINSLTPNEFNDSYFLLTQSEFWSRKMKNIAASGTMQIVNKSEFSNLSFLYPKMEEQQKIGVFFKQLDDTIALHQQELTTLKETKQGFLQKMFPKEGEQVPETRFPGFTDEWEQRKFTDIVNRVSTSSNSNRLPKIEFEDIIASEGRLNKDVSQKLDNRKGIVFEKNNILYGKLRPYLKNWLFTDFKGIALGDFWVFKAKNTDAKFDYYLIQADKYQKVANDTSGTKMPRSDWKQVSMTSFPVPTSDEQVKIGNFFKIIDDTIALHQRELDLLKETKKAFLQKMFV